MNSLASLKSVLLVLALAAGFFFAAPEREAFAACLSSGQARAIIAAGRALPLGRITSALRRLYKVDVIDGKLCADGRGFVYQLKVLGPRGRVRRVVVNAATGRLLSGRLGY